MYNPYYQPSWGSQNTKGYGDSSTYLDEQDPEMFPSQGGNMDYSQYSIGISSGLAAGAANSQPIGDFTVDAYSGFKGSGEGFMKGGAIGGIIGGATAQFGQFSKINKNLDNLDTGVSGVTYDAYGRPVYQGANFAQATGNMKALDKGISKLNKTHLDPATNVISSITGTRRRMKRKRAQLQQGFHQAQQDFNTADVNYRNQMLQRSEYLDRVNNNAQMYNVYRSQY